MAEIIGVISGVLGIVSPAMTKIESLVDRSQNFRGAPAEFRQLKSHCNAVRDSLRLLESNLHDTHAVLVPEDTQRFKSDAEIVKTNFKNVAERCKKLEKYFQNPRSDSSGCRACFLYLRQALLRLLLANTIAREFRHISTTVKDAHADGTELNRFLNITIQFKCIENHVTRVENQVKHVRYGVTAVDKKADTIENEVEHVRDGLSVVDKKVDIILQIADHSATDAKDHFRPPDCPCLPALSRNILLDYTSCDAENVPITMEGKLKRALLDIDSPWELSRVKVAVGAYGKGGVGKTNALLGLGWDTDVRKRFKSGGIYFLSFGEDAGVGHVIEELARAVENSGGARRARDILASKTLRKAIHIVERWFGERETLFLCDDMWETPQSNLGYFNELKQLLTSRGRSHMVLSTRAQSIAEAAGRLIEFGPRDPEGKLSRSILLKYAEISEEDIPGSCGEHQVAIRRILRKCSGLPLTLGVAGRAIQTKAGNCDGGFLTAILIYAEELETSTRRMMTEDIDGYPNLCATVRTSLEMVSRWAEKEEICGENGEALVCSDLFTRMNVFPRQSRIPQRTVKRLWGDVDDVDVTRIIDKLVDLNLLWKREDKANGVPSKVTVGLHDLILEYCAIQARRDPRSFHRDFLGEYLMAVSATADDCPLDKLSITPEPRRWWSLSSDGYFPENVCWHLWKGGCVGELMGLLCDVRWTVFRMRSGGLLRWKSDFESLKGALSEVKKEDRKEDGWDIFGRGVRLVRDAVKEAWGYLEGNERVLGMQVHSRLFDVDQGVWPVSRYLGSVRWHCEKPWLLPRGRYWAHPGEGVSEELLVGEAVKGIAMTKNGAMVAAIVGKEVLVIDVESRSIVRRLMGHEDEVTSVCISGDGAMIVSGSKGGMLRQWDGKSGKLMGEPLRGHYDKVSCVAMSADGAMIVSGSKDGTLRRWDGKSWAAMGEPLRGHDDQVTCVAMSEDGEMIVSGSEDRTLRRWNGRNGAAIGEPLRGHDGKVSCVAMSKVGAMTLSGSYDDATLCLWDRRTVAGMGKLLCSHDDNVTCVVVREDGALIVSGSKDRTLRRWNGKTGAPIGDPMLGHTDGVDGVAMSRDGRMIVSVSKDGTLLRWNGRTGAIMGKPLVLQGYMSCIAMKWDGAIIVSVSHETVQLWDARTGAMIGPLVGCHSLQSIEIENDVVMGRILDGSFVQWRVDKTFGLVDKQELDRCAGWFKGEDGSWVLRGPKSHQLTLYDRTGKQVVATLLSAVSTTDYKRVSFRAGGIGHDAGECSYTVGAVVAAGLDNGTVCIFHLITE